MPLVTLCVPSWFNRGNEPKQKESLDLPWGQVREMVKVHVLLPPLHLAALLSLGGFPGTFLLLWKRGELSRVLVGIAQPMGHCWPCSTGEYLGKSWGMAHGAEGWDRVLGQEGQRWHPAASHGVLLPGVEGFELGQLGPAAAALLVLGDGPWVGCGMGRLWQPLCWALWKQVTASALSLQVVSGCLFGTCVC